MKIKTLLIGGIALFVSACVSILPFTAGNTNASLRFQAVGGQCTAVGIGNGNVITAGHCSGNRTAVVNDTYLATRIWRNTEYDIALWRAPDLPDRFAAVLADRRAYVGEMITSVGDPLGNRDVFTFGKVGSTVASIGPWKAVQILNIAIAPGNSGGPIFDSNGEVLFISVGMFTRYGNLALGVPSRVVLKLLATGGKSPPNTERAGM